MAEVVHSFDSLFFFLFYLCIFSLLIRSAEFNLVFKIKKKREKEIGKYFDVEKQKLYYFLFLKKKKNVDLN